MACGVSYKTVTQWTWGYNKNGPGWLEIKPRGGRRRAWMTFKEESAFMDNLRAETPAASLVTAANVKAAVEKHLGKDVPKDYAYDLLWRHGWRKVMPRTHHPKADAQAREDFKKNSRKHWQAPPKL